MLIIHQTAQCIDCKNKPKVIQPDGTEATEKWICNHYKNRIPYDVLMKKKKCNFYSLNQ